ncbi:MAG: hypothetical protein QNJ46_33645 [Leptolyngbyaceae cyanobacterium MO_188.B28]|nr:hypothetical protein [Leptolyngbyaceae cyanobacterium MO_188.B28]
MTDELKSVELFLAGGSLAVCRHRAVVTETIGAPLSAVPTSAELFADVGEGLEVREARYLSCEDKLSGAKLRDVLKQGDYVIYSGASKLREIMPLSLLPA